jgi:hypothetical protein
MNPVEWIMVADVAVLITVTVGSAIAEARAVAARRRAATADWALLESWLRDSRVP